MTDTTTSAAHGLTRRALLQRSAVGATGLGLAALLAACGDDDAGGATSAQGGKLKLSLPAPGGAGSVWRPIWDQYDLGRGGPQIDWVGGDPGQVQTQLISGVVDASVFGALTTALANARGADIVIVGPALNNHGRWLVRNDSPYRTPKDLRGKRVASQPSNSDTYAQAAIVAALGGDSLRDDYTLLFGPPAANVALFERGDVDAIIAIEPSATRLVARGAREIARVGDLWKEYTGSDEPMLLNGRAVRASKLRDQHADVVAVIDAFTAANQKIVDDPTILSRLHREMGIQDSETEAIRLLPERMRDIYPVMFDAAARRGLDRQLREAQRLGLLEAAPSRPVYASEDEV